MKTQYEPTPDQNTYLDELRKFKNSMVIVNLKADPQIRGYLLGIDYRSLDCIIRVGNEVILINHRNLRTISRVIP